MHILWLKTELLHPLDKGGRIRTYQTLRHLRENNRVTYLCLDDGSASEADVERSTEYCHDLERVAFRAPARGSAGFFAALAGNIVSGLPYAVSRYRSRALESAVRRLVAQRGVDLVVTDFLTPSINLPRDLAVPTVLFQHNVEAAIWEQYAQAATNGVTRTYMREQWRRMKRFEGQECRRYDHVITVSELDKARLIADYGLSAVTAVNTGVDTEYFRPAGTVPGQAGEIVFTGSMDWTPNDQGIRWFATAVLPLIREQAPDAPLTVVGRNPSASLREFLGRIPRVEVTGTVPDIRPFLERAAVVVVPLHVGGGTRIKIFEAMAMGRPVVSTTLGAEGLQVGPGRDILIADDPAAFAAETLALLNDRGLAERIARAGADLVRSRFSWPRVAAQFGNVCEAVVASNPRRHASRAA